MSCVLTYERVIDPVFFDEDTVTSSSFLDMLEKRCSSTAQQQQPHSSRERSTCSCSSHCQRLLECELPRPMDRKRMTNCLASSFTASHAFGLFVWGYVKDQVHRQRVSMLDENTAATAYVIKAMLQSSWQEVDYVQDVCRAKDGAHCEVFCT